MSSARTSYRENDVRGASPVRLVVLLYEQLVQDLMQAAQALEQNDIALRTNRINHAVLVVGHLQSALDPDKGGKVAKDLDDFYDTLRKSLVQVQFLPSKGGFSQLHRVGLHRELFAFTQTLMTIVISVAIAFLVPVTVSLPVDLVSGRHFVRRTVSIAKLLGFSRSTERERGSRAALIVCCTASK